MRKILVPMVAAALAFPAVASAKDYATAGVIEVGGRVAFESRTTTTEIDAPGVDPIEASSTILELSPEVTYFLMDQLGLVGALVFQSDSTTVDDGDPVTATATGLQVGANYLFPVSSLHVGPELRLGFLSMGTDDGTNSETTAGPAISVGGVAKVPFGGGGVLGVGLGLDMHMGTVSADPDPGVDITRNTTSFGLNTSFTVFW